MILVDTSAWVDFLRGADSTAALEVRRLVSDALDELVICEPVAIELLADAPDEPALRRLERLVDGLPSLALDTSVDFRAAAGISRLARRAGFTVRSLNDCLIATVAVRHGATLVHKDADFEVTAGISDLKAVSVR